MGLLLHPYPMTAYISQQVAVEYSRAHATMQHNEGHRSPCVKHSTEHVETQHKKHGHSVSAGNCIELNLKDLKMRFVADLSNQI